jgi:hypothetical protein
LYFRFDTLRCGFDPIERGGATRHFQAIEQSQDVLIQEIDMRGVEGI